jgi:DNA-binding Lrp family transcriptional regulator
MDTDDLRLTRALQLAPRASFAGIAGVLGIHERTVARRYRRLRREGMLRIFGQVNPMAVGHQHWQVRVRSRPEASESLASALAARDDVAWVGVTAAGSQVAFTVRSLSAERRDLLLTRSLPRSAQVLGLQADVVLHIFLGLSSQGWSGLEGQLTPAEAAQLAGDAEPTPPVTTRLPSEPYDSALFELLAADGRAGTAELAAAAGISQGRAARRLTALIRSRTLVIDVDLAHGAYGFPVGAQLHLTVAPARLRQVGEALARLPEVGFVAAVSGRDNLTASVACRDLPHLYELITGPAGALEGVVSMETVPFARVVKQAGGLLVEGRLVDPPLPG